MISEQSFKCAICLEDQDLKFESTALLLCGHEFHKMCIDLSMKWCNKRCPICRKTAWITVVSGQSAATEAPTEKMLLYSSAMKALPKPRYLKMDFDHTKLMNANGAELVNLSAQLQVIIRVLRLKSDLKPFTYCSDGSYEEMSEDKDHKSHGAMPSFTQVYESAKNFRKNFAAADHTLRSYVKATCRRRIYRRQAVTQDLNVLEKSIANNKVLSNQRLQAKFSKYAETADKTLGLDELVMLLDKYKKYGVEITKSKQAFVDEIEDELKTIDDNFSRMLKSFQKDIEAVSKKATDFTTKLTDLCRREVYDLDKIFNEVENDYTRKMTALWEKGHSEVCSKDDTIMIQREELTDEIMNNMKILRTVKLESYLEVKLILDNDVLLMTEQLQNMRASFLVNAEKLDHNLEIIQLREDESIKTKNKQKRVITKIQDEVARATNELRAEEKKTKIKLTKHKAEYIDMTSELVQMHQTYDEAIRKEWKMFRDCWLSNELALRDSLRNLVLVDRFITEEISNHEWTAPPLWFLTHIGPIHAPRWRKIVSHYDGETRQLQSESPEDFEKRKKHDQKLCWSLLTSSNRRLATFRNLSLVRRPNIFEEPVKSTSSTDTGSSPYELPSHILGPVLRWILNHLDFFNEDYTVDVLNQMKWEDRMCFQMEAFLKEFKDFNYDDICKLALFFLRYSYKMNEKQAKNQPVVAREVDEWLKNLTPDEFLHRRIEFNDVFTALEAYMDYQRNEVDQEQPFDIIKCFGKGRDVSADKDYVNQYLTFIDMKKKAKEWEQLLYGIRKEAQISEKKLKLTMQTKMLQDKNRRLKSILHTYVSSKEDGKFIYPPLWSKSDDVSHVLSSQIGSTSQTNTTALLLRRRVATKEHPPFELGWSAGANSNGDGPSQPKQLDSLSAQKAFLTIADAPIHSIF